MGSDEFIGHVRYLISIGQQDAVRRAYITILHVRIKALVCGAAYLENFSTISGEKVALPKIVDHYNQLLISLDASYRRGNYTGVSRQAERFQVPWPRYSLSWRLFQLFQVQDLELTAYGVRLVAIGALLSGQSREQEAQDLIFYLPCIEKVAGRESAEEK